MYGNEILSSPVPQGKNLCLQASGRVLALVVCRPKEKTRRARRSLMHWMVERLIYLFLFMIRSTLESLVESREGDEWMVVNIYGPLWCPTVSPRKEGVLDPRTKYVWYCMPLIKACITAALLVHVKREEGCGRRVEERQNNKRWCEAGPTPPPYTRQTRQCVNPPTRK